MSLADILKVCRFAIELEIKEAEEYAVHLLTTRFADRAGPAIEELLQNPKPKIRKKAQQIQQAIYQVALPQIRISTLGNFSVQHDDILIEEGKWQGALPKNLLKAIVARGPSNVAKEVIIEDLWPEGRPESADRNFKVTLHRLRKALEPSTDKASGSAYIHLKDGFISLDKDLCQVDMDEFLLFYDQGKNKEKSGDVKAAINQYEEAAKLYLGDFLPDDLYSPWADEKRLELRQNYLELLFNIADLYESSGKITKAISSYKKIVKYDPLSEKAYQRLMTLHADRGQRSAALKVYEDCRQALLTGLDTEPDETTIAIYKKILDS